MGLPRAARPPGRLRDPARRQQYVRQRARTMALRRRTTSAESRRNSSAKCTWPATRPWTTSYRHAQCARDGRRVGPLRGPFASGSGPHADPGTLSCRHWTGCSPRRRRPMRRPTARPGSGAERIVPRRLSSASQDLQQQFIRELLHRDSPGGRDQIVLDAESPASGIYRTNTRETFALALEGAFPLLHSCTGEGGFPGAGLGFPAGLAVAGRQPVSPGPGCRRS